MAEWAKNKPLRGDVPPPDALATLAVYERRAGELQKALVELAAAKQALDLEVSSGKVLDPVLEEIEDLKSVWEQLQTVWEKLTPMRETAWTAVIPRKVRSALEEFNNELKKLPAQMRQYEAYEYLKTRLKGWVKVNGLITDLRSEASL